jgi:hypothetical protein
MAKHDDKRVTVNVFKDHGPAGFAAFLAFIGAFVYFAQNAHDFVGYFNAFVDAIVWPAILVYHVLLMLHA